MFIPFSEKRTEKHADWEGQPRQVETVSNKGVRLDPGTEKWHTVKKKI